MKLELHRFNNSFTERDGRDNWNIDDLLEDAASHCAQNGVPVREEWLTEAKNFEQQVLLKR